MTQKEWETVHKEAIIKWENALEQKENTWWDWWHCKGTKRCSYCYTFNPLMLSCGLCPLKIKGFCAKEWLEIKKLCKDGRINNEEKYHKFIELSEKLLNRIKRHKWREEYKTVKGV